MSLQVHFSDPGTITSWVAALQAGQPEMIDQIWSAFFQPMIQVAQNRLRKHRRLPTVEAEDAAQSAFHAFSNGVKLGQFPPITDREALWALLTTLTLNKVIDHLRREGRFKRGDGMTRRDCLDELASAAKTDPAVQIMLRDLVKTLFDRLHDDQSRQIALHKLEGYTNLEMAEMLNCSAPTIQRKLKLIRDQWRRWSENKKQAEG